MSSGNQSIVERARERTSAIRTQLAEQFPHLSSPTRSIDRTAIVPGRDQHDEPLPLSIRTRLEHMLVVGTTGGGKTKLIEQCVRQDIVDGRGVCVVDPHGNHPDSLYRSLLCWLDHRGLTNSRTIHLVDPNAEGHVTGLNPLELPSEEYQPSVIAEAMQEALERLWGEEDLNGKPTLQRVLAGILATLTELKLTLAEARLLFDPEDRDGIRAWAIANLSNREAREELEWLHAIAAEPRGRQDFRQELTGPRNRIAKLTRDEAIRAIVGQQERTIDFRAALDEGHIILANLSPGPHAGDKATQLLGRLLTRLLFFHCQRRVRPDRAFFMYLDECQLYLSGDISRMLGEARKYGVGAVLATQALANFRIAGEEVLDAVKNMTNIKAALRIKNPEEAAELADMIMPYDLELPVKALVKPVVVGHRLVQLNAESVSKQSSITSSQSQAEGRSVTKASGASVSASRTVGASIGFSDNYSSTKARGQGRSQNQGSGTGKSTAEQFRPPKESLFGKEELEDPIGVTKGTNSEENISSARSSSVSRSRTRGSAFSHANSRSSATSESRTESIARGQSYSRTSSSSEMAGASSTRGWSEAFEPIYENRPTAVHSLETIRYMASTALRHLTAGRAVLSFVDSEGMKCGSLKVANVQSYALRQDKFEALRLRIFTSSPSATPRDLAMAQIANREATLRQLASPEPAEPETTAAFRTKRKRKAIVETPVDLHDERSASERTPVKGPDRLRRRPKGRP